MIEGELIKSSAKTVDGEDSTRNVSAEDLLETLVYEIRIIKMYLMILTNEEIRDA